MLRYQHLLPAGYVYTTAQILAHVDLDIKIDPTGDTVLTYPSTALVYGDCSAEAYPAVLVGLYIGVDSSNMGIGLAAALQTGIPYFGWSVCDLCHLRVIFVTSLQYLCFTASSTIVHKQKHSALL